MIFYSKGAWNNVLSKLCNSCFNMRCVTCISVALSILWLDYYLLWTVLFVSNLIIVNNGWTRDTAPLTTPYRLSQIISMDIRMYLSKKNWNLSSPTQLSPRWLPAWLAMFSLGPHHVAFLLIALNNLNIVLCWLSLHQHYKVRLPL